MSITKTADNPNVQVDTDPVQERFRVSVRRYPHYLQNGLNDYLCRQLVERYSLGNDVTLAWCSDDTSAEIHFEEEEKAKGFVAMSSVFKVQYRAIDYGFIFEYHGSTVKSKNRVFFVKVFMKDLPKYVTKESLIYHFEFCHNLNPNTVDLELTDLDKQNVCIHFHETSLSKILILPQSTKIRGQPYEMSIEPSDLTNTLLPIEEDRACPVFIFDFWEQNKPGDPLYALKKISEDYLQINALDLRYQLIDQPKEKIACILQNIPKHIQHLDLSCNGLGRFCNEDLYRLLTFIPHTVRSIGLRHNWIALNITKEYGIPLGAFILSNPKINIEPGFKNQWWSCNAKLRNTFFQSTPLFAAIEEYNSTFSDSARYYG